HKDISTLQMDSHFLEIKNANNYGIMVDESKCNGIKNFLICFIFWSTIQNKPLAIMTHLKDIDRCDGKSVSQTVQKTIENAHIDIKKCLVWLTDNTAYMSGNQNGAIALFNKKTNSDIIRIGCGLYIMHIVYNNFEKATFGKLSSAIGFTQVAHHVIYAI
ncbi:772_t:CDS:1, partial [Funneliformis geosporum]